MNKYQHSEINYLGGIGKGLFHLEVLLELDFKG